MKNRKKALLLSCLTSLVVLTGCGSATKTIDIDGQTYIQDGEEYVKLNMEPKTFEPGEHVIYFTYNTSGSFGGSKGWGTSNIGLPETPEGYKYVNSFSIDEGTYGFTDSIVHMYVNEVTVEVTPTYNSKTNKIEYTLPGVVVESLKLND